MTSDVNAYPLFGPGRHLLSVQQFDRPGLQRLFQLADTV